MAQVVTKIETEIEKHRITIRTDRAVHRDLGMKKKMLMLLLNYNPLWLRIGLETVYGQIIPMDGTTGTYLFTFLDFFLFTLPLSSAVCLLFRCVDIESVYFKSTFE